MAFGVQIGSGYVQLKDGAVVLAEDTEPCCCCDPCPAGLSDTYTLTGNDDGTPFTATLTRTAPGVCQWTGSAGIGQNWTLGRITPAGAPPDDICGFNLRYNINDATTRIAGNDPTGAYPDFVAAPSTTSLTGLVVS